MKLDPPLVQGLLRVGGRLGRETLPDVSKHHIVIARFSSRSPSSKPFSREKWSLLREYVLALLRERFWQIRVNSAVRTVLSSFFLAKGDAFLLVIKRWHTYHLHEWLKTNLRSRVWQFTGIKEWLLTKYIFFYFNVNVSRFLFQITWLNIISQGNTHNFVMIWCRCPGYIIDHNLIYAKFRVFGSQHDKLRTLSRW